MANTIKDIINNAVSENMSEPTGELLLAISSMAHGLMQTPSAKERCDLRRAMISRMSPGSLDAACDKGPEGVEGEKGIT